MMLLYIRDLSILRVWYLYREGNGTPLQNSCLENPMEGGWMVGCSPCGCKESDTTEQLHFHFSLSCIGEGNGNPLQCSWLENHRDRGPWWAAVYGVAQSLKRLSDLAAAAAAAISWWCPSLHIYFPYDHHIHLLTRLFLCLGIGWMLTCMVNYFTWQICEMDTIFLLLKVMRWTHRDSRWHVQAQFSSIAQSCLTLCDPMHCSMPGLPVHHQLPEFTQTHVIESVMPSRHLILSRPLLPPPIPPSIRVFSNESTLCMRLAKVL